MSCAVLKACSGFKHRLQLMAHAVSANIGGDEFAFRDRAAV